MKNIKFFIIAIVAVMMTSCYTTRTYTGNFIEQTDHGDTNVMPYSKAKQWYVIGSLVPLGQKHAPTPSTGNCEVVTKTKFVDALLGECTLGLFAVRTIEVNAVASDGLTSLLKPKKEKYVIDNGLQYEIEAGGLIGAAGLISYKFAKRFSVGVGYWKGFLRSDDWDFGGYDDEGTLRKMGKFYFNAQIRPWDKGFSPVVGANLGWQTVHMAPISGIFGEETSDYYGDYYSDYYGDKQTQLVLTPYVGLSWRLGKNCYLSWRVGYNMAAGKVKLKDEEEGSRYKLPEKIGVSSPYTALNFTHTLPIGAGLHEKAIEKTRSVIDKVKKK